MLHPLPSSASAGTAPALMDGAPPDADAAAPASAAAPSSAFASAQASAAQDREVAHGLLPASYTGVAADGRPQSLDDFLRTDVGQAVVVALRQRWDDLLNWMQPLVPGSQAVPDLRRLLAEMMDGLSSRGTCSPYLQAAMVGHGKRALEAFLPLIRNLPVSYQRIVASQLMALLREPQPNPARCISHALTRLRCALPEPFRGQQTACERRQNEALWRALRSHFAEQDGRGTSPAVRATTEAEKLLHYLGQSIDEDLYRQAVPPLGLAPHEVERIVMAMERAAAFQPPADLLLSMMRPARLSRWLLEWPDSGDRAPYGAAGRHAAASAQPR